MSIINTIIKNSSKAIYTFLTKTEVYADIIEDTLKHSGLYPNKDDYIDYALYNDLKLPINDLINMVEKLED